MSQNRAVRLNCGIVAVAFRALAVALVTIYGLVTMSSQALAQELPPSINTSSVTKAATSSTGSRRVAQSKAAAGRPEVGVAKQQTTTPPGSIPASKSYPFKWYGNRAYQDCGQECLYGKGTEQLSFQALFILSRYTLVEGKKKKDGQVDQNDLKDVCVGSISDADCWTRFRAMTILQLQQVRQAIARNDNGRLALDTLNGNPAMARLLAEGEVDNKFAHTPDVRSYEELQKFYDNKANQALRETVTPQYMEMVGERAWKPSRDQFVLVEKIDANSPAKGNRPANPSDKVRTWIVKDSDGNPVIDQDAYKVALDEWEKSQPDPKMMLQTKKEDSDADQKRRASGAKLGFDDPNQVSDMEVEAYKMARESMVNAGNARKPLPKRAFVPGGKATAGLNLKTGKKVDANEPSGLSAGSGSATTPSASAVLGSQRIPANAGPGTFPKPNVATHQSSPSPIDQPRAQEVAKKDVAGEPKVFTRNGKEVDFKAPADGGRGSGADSYFLIYRPENIQDQINAIVKSP